MILLYGLRKPGEVPIAILISSSKDRQVLIHVLDSRTATTSLQMSCFLKFRGVGWDWVHLVRRPLFCVLYPPRMMDDECGAVGGMRIGRGNRNTRRKCAPVPLCPPQIPHDLTWAPTRAAAAERWRLTAWAMARPRRGVTNTESNLDTWGCGRKGRKQTCLLCKASAQNILATGVLV
jgi:hypothetical protein